VNVNATALPPAPEARSPRATLRTAVVMLVLMVLVAFASMALRPPTRSADAAPKYQLEQVVPKQFGEWREIPPTTPQVVNPGTQQLLDQLYSQMLMRTYVHSSGYRVMLSLAYGDDQRGNLQAHMPDVCYPAQGFKLEDQSESELATPFGNLHTRRISTRNQMRAEPVTYWYIVGDTQVHNRIEQRFVEIKMGFAGEPPDGLLFRVSSIDEQPTRAYGLHDQFVQDLLKALPALDRARLAGLKPAGATP
jgi:EpsI family protein